MLRNYYIQYKIGVEIHVKTIGLNTVLYTGQLKYFGVEMFVFFFYCHIRREMLQSLIKLIVHTMLAERIIVYIRPYRI